MEAARDGWELFDDGGGPADADDDSAREWLELLSKTSNLVGAKFLEVQVFAGRNGWMPVGKVGLKTSSGDPIRSSTDEPGIDRAEIVSEALSVAWDDARRSGRKSYRLAIFLVSGDGKGVKLGKSATHRMGGDDTSTGAPNQTKALTKLLTEMGDEHRKNMGALNKVVGELPTLFEAATDAHARATRTWAEAIDLKSQAQEEIAMSRSAAPPEEWTRRLQVVMRHTERPIMAILMLIGPGIQRGAQRFAEAWSKMDDAQENWDQQTNARHGPPPAGEPGESAVAAFMRAHKLAQHLVSTFTSEQHDALGELMDTVVSEGTYQELLSVIASTLKEFKKHGASVAKLLSLPDVKMGLVRILDPTQTKLAMDIQAAVHAATTA